MKKNQTYLVVDTETGGLDPEKQSILSIAGVAWQANKCLEPLFDFYICEEEIETTKRALEVNKIDLEVVKEEGYGPYEAVKEIKKALNKRFTHDRKPIMLVGHNIAFDIGFIKRLYNQAGQDYYSDFKDRALDTATILEFFMIAGEIEGFRASADVLFKATGVEIDEKDRHTAKGDAVATAKAIDELVSILKEKDNGQSKK
jgi:DNA polymerase III alpha subunit (gram-positive type)